MERLEREKTEIWGCIRGHENARVSSPFHEVDHIDNARCTDHGLISEDSPHGLFNTELWLQGRQKRLNLLPDWREKYNRT